MNEASIRLDLCDLLVQSCMRYIVEETQVTSEEEMIFELTGGAH
jgi:hypothetical protein